MGDQGFPFLGILHGCCWPGGGAARLVVVKVVGEFGPVGVGAGVDNCCKNLLVLEVCL